jgi:hypothetical protein
MLQFNLFFPELGQRETRFVMITEPPPPEFPDLLPPDQYGFVEWFSTPRH